MMLGQERKNDQDKFIESVLLHALCDFHAKRWINYYFLNMWLEIIISKPKSKSFN